MQFAIDSNNIRVTPTPNRTGVCPGCKNDVVAKCGEINIWHWSHRKGQLCDSFYEPETYWHRAWKEVFGSENTEVIIRKDEKWHFADILTKGGVVIELQNSPLKVGDIKEREEFYGEKMLWVLNSERFGSHFSINGLGYFPSPSPLYQTNISIARGPDKIIRAMTVDFGKERHTTRLIDIATHQGHT